MILIIDNYDSFTYNLVQLIGELGAEMHIVRNDKMTVDEAQALQPSHILISPGPGRPDDGGISLDIIRTMGASTPILGVCLGHQCIAQAYGGVVTHAPRLMHGKTSMIYHKCAKLFTGVPSPFQATRYHSLIADEDALPKELLVSAFTDDGEIMAIKHTTHPVMGLQFHPESILTDFGARIVGNFLENMF
jgi:anthranilate synthase component II